MTILFKLGMALVFAVIAAIVVFLTGLFNNARLATASLRSLVAFLCAGTFTYLVAFILEAKGWAAFDKEPEERMRDMQTQVYHADDIDFDAAEDGKDEEAAEAFAEPASFKPLSENSLVHMTAPPAEEQPTDGEEAPAPA